MAEKSIPNGRFVWDIRYRQRESTGGLSLRLLGPVNSERKELARFDCFRVRPHYHTAVHDHNTVRPIEEDDSVAWAFEQCNANFETLVVDCGGDVPTPQELEDHTDTVALVKAYSENLVAEETKRESEAL